MLEGRAQRLITAGEYKKAAAWLAERGENRISERVLKAWIDFEMGETADAALQAEQLLKEPLDRVARARCMGIAGRSQGRLGSSVDGLLQIRKAIDLVTGFDPHVEADLRGDYVSASLSWIGVEPALAELPTLRRVALQSANRSALIEFHIAYARVSALRGWWRRVDAELEAAASLLLTDPHPTLEWRLEQVRASVAIMFGDVESAVRRGSRCLELAETSGSKFQLASTLANLAHIAAVAGDFDRARDRINRSHQMLAPLSQMRFATIGTGINVGLATTDASFSKQMVDEGMALADNSPSAVGSYYHLWFILHRVRWLLDQNKFEEAASDSLAAVQAVVRLADTDLADRLRLLAAEAFARQGAMERANELVAEVFDASGERTLETIAESHRVAAIVRHSIDPAEAFEHLVTAWRLLSATGLLGPRAHVESTARLLGLLNIVRESRLGPLTPRGAALAIALIPRLGRYPRAIASELAAVVERLGICESVTIHECVDAARPSGLSDINEAIPSSLAGPDAHQGAIELRIAASLHLHIVPNRQNSFRLFFSYFQALLEASRVYSERPPSEEEVVPWPSQAAINQFGMVAASDRMIELLGTTRRLAPSGITVLITGETGTGKELLAKALHEASPREKRSFIPFNCSACSREMLDAQLFGYKRGAFTGANEAFQGVIRAAAGGTLFLDEIGELTLDVQPKLLRFLESGEIHPLGEPRPIHVDVRIVAATNADLEKLVADGKFREDLFYRLNVVRLQVPPLRERREEIPPLVQHYLDKSSREAHKSGIRVADETMEYLILYKWPGNVRQLGNEVRRMVALAESGAVLMPEHLSNDIASSRRTIPASERWVAPMEFVVRMDQPMSAAIEHLERSMVQYALKMTSGRLEDAAQLLGLSRKGLYLKRQRLHIDDLGGNDDAGLAAATADPTLSAPTHSLTRSR